MNHWSTKQEADLMNDRERFLATMNYQPRDRCPWWEMWYWPETLDRWHERGPARGRPPASSIWAWTVARMSASRWAWCPVSSARRWRRPTSYEIFRRDRRRDLQAVQGRPGPSACPSGCAFPLETREDWENDHQAAPGPHLALPLPALLGGKEAHLGAARLSRSPSAAGSIFGWMRNWMGLEGICAGAVRRSRPGSTR